MSLPAGDKLGSYEILAPLGAGGMGEVYRARDTKLDREVAIKVLPSALAQDPERLARFEREAKVLASLNHPNIAQIYGIEERALVMELVPGETLKGPLPFETVLNYARQIADALEAAHEKGITHRDLKPANIMVTPAGVVKVLDFGLASVPSREAGTDSTKSPTLTMAATQAGTIMGTAAYMSPEQAKGKPVDRRADIWAFGVVVWEMLAGERLFQGEDTSDILASVIKDEPRWEPIPKQAHKLLKACLQKDPKRRLNSIADAMLLLDDAPATNEIAPPEAVEVPAPRSTLPWIVAIVLALGLTALAFIHFREKPQATPVLRYTVAAPERSTVHSIAISPDGRYLVISAAGNGKQQLWLRPLDALQAQPMPGTEDAAFPFWSPDSRYVGFFAQGKLKKVAVSGGPSESLCDAPRVSGGSWSREDVIIFSNSSTSIRRVSAAGGVPVDVTKNEGDLRHPVFLPDDRHFLFLRGGLTLEKNGIYVGSLDGTEDRRILADVSGAVFAPPSISGGKSSGKLGYILFVRENTLMAQPFDSGSAQPAGDVFPVSDGVGLTTIGTYAPVTVSDSGVLLYASGGAAGVLNQIAWFDRTGKLLDPVGAPGAVFEPAISPVGNSVVFARASGSTYDLWLRDLDRGTETRFTSDTSVNVTPFWSPQGDRIVFASSRHAGGAFNLFQKAASGSAQEEVLLTDGNIKEPTQWSRDGRFIVYEEIAAKTKLDLWVLPVEGAEKERKPVLFMQTEFNELMAQLSPDSHWMAYTSDQSGRREVYVRPFPRAEGQWTISVAGGRQPRWRGDGKELFYEAADGKMMAVPVKASAAPKPTFEAGAPVALFDAHIAPTATNNVVNYDVTADGKRFLIATPVGPGASSSPPLTVVVNWNAASKK
jgi:Tol biopolymer transport system component/predicted Ser/Thr protein kinase